MERAQRRLLITYPKRQHGNQVYEGQTSFLPLKLNTSGVIPPIFASSLLLLPTTIANFSQTGGTRHPRDDLAPISAMAGRSICIALCRPDRLLRLLLHRDRVQSRGDRRQSEEAWRLHSGHPAGRAHRAIYRLRADPHHGARRRLSRDHLPLTGNADFLCRAAVLFRRHVAAHRGQRDDGYGGAGPWASAGASI